MKLAASSPGYLKSALFRPTAAVAICFAVLVLQDCFHINERESATPLMRAAAKGDTAEVQRLLTSGANIRVVDAHGRTALMYACSSPKDSPALVEALLSAGSDINAVDQWGRTPLHLAVDTLGAAFGTELRNIVEEDTPRHKAVIRRLIEAHPKINVADSKGLTPLMVAAAFTDPETVQILVSGGAEVNFRNSYGATALSIATRRNKKGVVQALRDAGASP